MSLSETKKLYLVDAAQLKQLPINNNSNYIERSKPLPNKELESLDNTMLQIINNPLLSTDDKVQAYNRILTEYQSMISNHTPILSKDSSSKHIKDNPQELQPYDPLISIPSQYKNKARNLWSMLKSNDQLKVSANGQVSIKGDPIAGSNISDMINKAVNSKAKLKYIPGWEQFESLLNDANIPRFMLNSRYTSSVPTVVAKPSGIKTRRLLQHNSVYDGWETHDSSKEKKKRLRKKPT